MPSHEGVTSEQLQGFIPVLLSMVKIDALLAGNLTREVCREGVGGSLQWYIPLDGVHYVRSLPSPPLPSPPYPTPASPWFGNFRREHFEVWSLQVSSNARLPVC